MFKNIIFLSGILIWVPRILSHCREQQEVGNKTQTKNSLQRVKTSGCVEARTQVSIVRTQLFLNDPLQDLSSNTVWEDSSRLRRVLRGGAEGGWRNPESRGRRGMKEAREGYPPTRRISDLQLVGSQACVYTRVMQSITRTEEPNRGLGISNSIANNWCLSKCTHGPALCCFTLPSFRVGPNYCPVLQMENCAYCLTSNH